MVPRLLASIQAEVGVTVDELAIARIAPQLQAEALIFHDPADREVPFEDGVAIAHAWPGARLRAVEGRGHRRILRAEEVVQEAVMFLTGVEPGQSNRDVVLLPDTLAVRSAA